MAMLLKLLLCTCIFALVASQDPVQPDNTCDGNVFNFYGLYCPTYGYPSLWDWDYDNFDDGEDDTFDSYFYMYINIDGTDYNVDPGSVTLIDSQCITGTTDFNSSGQASFTFEIASGLQATRSFWVPRWATWMRALDTFTNMGESDLTFTVYYYGNYGSDSDTYWQEISDTYWYSTELNTEVPSDQPFSVNAGRNGSLVTPVKSEGYFDQGNDDTEWSFTLTVPAGEYVHLMHVLNQADSRTEGFETLHLINIEPAVLVEDVDDVTKIVNWNFCGEATFEVSDPNAVYCTTAPTISIISEVQVGELTWGDQTLTPTGPEFEAVVPAGGVFNFEYKRPHPSCPSGTFTAQLTVSTLPEADFALNVDTTGDLPVATATGGWGDYSYVWTITGGDLEEAFGAKASVVATDSKGCTASAEVTLPELPQGSGPSAVPVAKGPTTSGSSQLVGSVGLLALAALF